MSLPSQLSGRLRLPVVASPLFIVSGPEMVIAQCKAGIVGSFPALNARPASLLDEWLHQITEELAAWDRDNPDRPAAPFAVNHIVHKSNDRLDHDLEVTTKRKVPILITSLGAREDVNAAAHSYGGLVFHDVINNKFARKAVEKGADGVIAVAAGAGGHAGTISPFALIQEIREWYDGTLILGGAIASGRAILAAQAMGADLAYVGSRFIASQEANASEAYKQMVVDSSASDIVYTNIISGVHGNYLGQTLTAAGIDVSKPTIEVDTSKISFGGGDEKRAKAWKDIWGCGQGIGAITSAPPVAEIVATLETQYLAAKGELDARFALTAPRRTPVGVA